MFFPELCVRRGGIFAYADDFRSERFELPVERAEGARLTGTAGSVVLGIEIQNERFARKVIERILFADIVAEGEVGRPVAYVEHIVCLL